VTAARSDKRPQTLKRRADFLRVAATRRRFVTPGFILQAAARPEPTDDAPPRIGFTASRKVGGAVQRNRAKRRLREIARALMPDLAKNGVDYVLIARQETGQRDFALLQEDLRRALTRIDLRAKS
jgi:ribonuclease P protein component